MPPYRSIPSRVSLPLDYLLELGFLPLRRRPGKVLPVVGDPAMPYVLPQIATRAHMKVAAVEESFPQQPNLGNSSVA